MSRVRFTHQIMVPNHKSKIDAADGYADEMADVTVFTLSQEEYDALRQEGGIFDLFDHTFGTVIDDCEEDRLTYDQVIQALELTRHCKRNQSSMLTSGLDKVTLSLEYAKQVGVFWEIVNGAEMCE
ncbi:MAG: hypothetical protein IJ865_02470 [Clostridia bacterium]|nr:hypothetical protein [Clostridia bacterium]